MVLICSNASRTSSSVISSMPGESSWISRGTREATIFKYSAGLSVRTVSMTVAPYSAKSACSAAMKASERTFLLPLGLPDGLPD